MLHTQSDPVAPAPVLPNDPLSVSPTPPQNWSPAPFTFSQLPGSNTMEMNHPFKRTPADYRQFLRNIHVHQFSLFKKIAFHEIAQFG